MTGPAATGSWVAGPRAPSFLSPAGDDPAGTSQDRT
jgi:hypothetical protein